MVAIAHFIAITCYLGAAALAATPFARPVPAPVRGVIAGLGLGVTAHLTALVLLARAADQIPLTGLGPALSFAGLAVALLLLIVEILAREVSLTLVAAPLAALATSAGTIVGLAPAAQPAPSGAWLYAHVALSFLGIAAFATAAAAGTIYLVERRELKSRRFGAIFRFFPPLATLDRVNHFAAIGGWLTLTLGVVLAIGYSVAYEWYDPAKLLWALSAWVAAGAIAIGRVLGGWQARRAAVVSSVGFVAVIVLYLAVRLSVAGSGKFL